MSNLKRCLDNVTENESFDKKSIIYDKRDMNRVVRSINKNFVINNTDPYIKNALDNVYIPRKIIIKKEKVTINKEINSLSDLLQLIIDYPITENAEYNINLTRLHKIKQPLIELNNMIGLNDLKNSILDQILFYVQDLHLNSGIDYMHTVLYGPPGTGKTEIAKIIGRIFSKLGILKNETFRKVVRSDLIAGYLGQTAIKTTKVIEEALDGVLFIDEVYALGNSEKRDSFSKECIDTICETLSDYKDRLMVIIAGYEEEINECFFSYNKGLKSRFPWSFKTDKYTPDDLNAIFIKKVNDIKWKLDVDELICTKFFKDNIDAFLYYGRDIEILLLKIKIVHSRRIFCLNNDMKTIINNADLVNGFELFKKNSNIEKQPDNIIYTMYN